MARKKVLVADDDDGIRELLKVSLAADGYDVLVAPDGQKAMEVLAASKPDCVILDVDMPLLNGFEVLEKIRENPQTRLLPVIMLTVQAAVKDRITGLKLGADDYIPKPFSPPEISARIEAMLRRVDQMRSSNPLTGLPGNIVIEEEINQRIASRKPFAVLYVDMDNFKAYNDVYGFEKGDEAIKMTAAFLRKSATLCGSPSDVLCHLGGDDFVVITTPDKIDPICQDVIESFDVKAQELYTAADRMRGYIVARNRQGIEQDFPLMSLSIAVVTNEQRDFKHFAEVAAVAAEVKHIAKQRKRSTYFRDRRVD